MPFPRTTMKDVAQKLGVHTTTVSLALRNSPKLPVETRQRIQELAKTMGYHQDPMLSALTAYRTNLAVPKSQPTVAMIFDFKSQTELDQASLSYHNFLEGVTRKAEELGYIVNRFFFEGHSRSTEGRRIGHLLSSRGIKGVILCAFRPRTISFRLEWDEFSVVQIECQHLGLPLHLISTDQVMMARETVRRLWKQGYRRIGIAVGREEEIYLDHAFTVGFNGETALHPELEPIPPLLLTNGQTMESFGNDLDRWIKQHRIDAVISNWTNVSKALAGIGAILPPGLIVIEMGPAPEQSAFGGMTQRDTVVGERAMEQLAMLLKTNQTGCVEMPNRILVPGVWIDGTQAIGSKKKVSETAEATG
jgi:LacI family transcriptional regulator